MQGVMSLFNRTAKAKLIPLESATNFDGFSRPNILYSFFYSAKWVWIILIFGWVVVLLSIILGFEIPSSGAVLVCSAVLAEVKFERIWYRKLPRGGLGVTNFLNLGRSDEGVMSLHRREGNQHMSMYLGEKLSSELRALFGLTPESSWCDYNEQNGRGEVGAFWPYEHSIQKVEKLVTLHVCISAIVGTLIWGYAHCFLVGGQCFQ
jgi:hypothetical protein